MASGDRRVGELPAATAVLDDDLFVLEQNDEPKSLSGSVLVTELLKKLDGHGGIQSWEKTGTAGLVDTYTITFVDGSTKELTVTNGEKGDKGDPCFVWIKYASQRPTEESHSMSNLPDDWIGIYVGFEESAPSDWQMYSWFKFKGEPGESIKGDTGETPQIRIGTVTTVEFDQPASATISGTKENPVLNLMIPAGQPGANGENSADWSENYSNNPGYVLNRTHYVKSEENPFAGISVTFGATPYADFSTDLLTDNLGYHILYRVRFDGKEYFCQSRDLYAIRNTHTVAIGNCSIVDSYCEDTGEPFLIELYTSEKGSGRISCPGYANKTVEVIIDKAEDVYKLDNKYLDAVWTAEKHYRGVDGLLINYKKIEFTSSNTVYNGVPNYWLDEGGKYDVYWNRQLYECVCFNRDGALYLGNGSLAGETGGEEAPFCFVSFGGSSVFVYKDAEDAETVDITVIGHRETLMEKIPKEFLPDDIGSGGGGVNVTGATPGQMIIVKAVDDNGKPTEWEAVDRTHWVEDGGMTELIPETTLTPDDEGIIAIPTEVPNLVVGDTYTVDWNGVEYSCVAQEYTQEGMTASFIGNVGLVTGEGIDTGEPFIILRYPDDAVAEGAPYAMIMVLDGSTSVTLSIYGNGDIVHKLNNKFLDLEWIPAPKGEKTLVPKFTVSNGDSFAYDFSGVISNGQKVNVIFDGVKYECTATISSDMLLLSDVPITDTIPESYTFVIGGYPNGLSIMCADGEHTLSISVNEYEKIPQYYLSELHTIDTIDYDSIDEANRYLEQGHPVKYSNGFVLGAQNTDARGRYLAHANPYGFHLYNDTLLSVCGSPTVIAAMFAPVNVEIGQHLEVMQNGSQVLFRTVDPWVLTAPDGTKYKLSVDNSGALSTEKVT